MQRKGRVRLEGLDGAREREFDVPDNWAELSIEEQRAIWRPVKERLMDDSVSFAVDIDCRCDDDTDYYCGCED